MTPGTIPSRTSLNANFAPRATTAMSQAATSPLAPPNTLPCTRPITGRGNEWITRNRAPRRRASSRFSSGEAAPSACISARSAPAQKSGPSPDSTTARTAGSAVVDRNASVNSAINACDMALRASGRFMATRSTPFCRETFTNPSTRFSFCSCSASDYIRMTPKVVSGIGAFVHAESARPSTSRVCRGSMTPSSQRRPVE